MSQQDKDRQPKSIRSNSTNLGKLYYHQFQTETDEAIAITHIIREFINSKEISDLGEIAIIARARWRTNNILRVLDKEKIAWFDRSKLSYHDGWEVLFGLNILALSENIDSSVHLHQVMATIENAGLANTFSGDDAVAIALDIRQKLKVNKSVEEHSPEVLKRILNVTGYWNLLEKSTWSITEYRSHVSNIENMLSDLSNLSTQKNISLSRAILQLIGADAVQILTGQESKGREFKFIFFIGLEEGLIPDRRNIRDADLLAEERRIFYVGLTRAKKAAYLSSVSERLSQRGEKYILSPSRFLMHIPSDILTPYPLYR